MDVARRGLLGIGGLAWPLWNWRVGELGKWIMWDLGCCFFVQPYILFRKLPCCCLLIKIHNLQTLVLFTCGS